MSRLIELLTRIDTRTRLGAITVVLVVQATLLVWFRANPESVPAAVRLGTIAASLVVAVLLAGEAYSFRTGTTTSWWRPDWRRWAIGGVVLGLNAGVFLAYLLRRREAESTDGPSGYWKIPLVLGVVATVVGTAVVSIYFNPDRPGLAGSALLFVLLNGVGFSFAAVYYDTRYVQRALSASGSGWLFSGYHWVVLVGLPIPGRIILLLLYVLRRRMLLGRVADGGADIEALPTDETELDSHTGADAPDQVPADAQDQSPVDADKSTAKDRQSQSGNSEGSE